MDCLVVTWTEDEGALGKSRSCQILVNISESFSDFLVNLNLAEAFSFQEDTTCNFFLPYVSLAIGHRTPTKCGFYVSGSAGIFDWGECRRLYLH